MMRGSFSYQHNLTIYFFNYILHAQGFLEYFCRAMTGGLTTKYRVYTIADKNDRGPDASLRTEMGNPN